DALGGRIPAGALRDKIVLVGINALSVQDVRVTPIDRTQHGVEVQAMTVNQLLRYALDGDQPMQILSDRVEDGWILLWCLIGGVIGNWVRSPWKIAVLTSVCLVSLPAIVWLAFAAGWWIPLVGPAVGFVGASALGVSYASSRE